MDSGAPDLVAPALEIWENTAMESVSTYVDRYYRARAALEGHPVSQEKMEFARGQAMAYLWGRMDAGDRSGMDPLTSDAFSWAYGLIVGLMELGKITSHGPIREMWEEFRTKDGTVSNLRGERIDNIELAPEPTDSAPSVRPAYVPD